MDERIITLATYPNIIEASIVKGRLEDVGIESFIVEATVAHDVAVPGPNYGGIHLNIREGDKPKAFSVIYTSPR
jgi:hypothetical protein